MSWNKNGRTLKEDIKLIHRGLREFNRILPGQLQYVAGRSLVGAVSPYVAVIAMAGILGELTGGRSVEKLLLYVAVSLAAAFLLTVVKSILEARISVGYSDLFAVHEIHLTDKAYGLPYELLESEEVRSLRDQVSGSISVSGAGMASLYWDMEAICASLCTGVLALVLCIRYGARMAPGVLPGLLAPTLLCAWVSCRMTSRRWDVSYQVFEQGAAYQRYGDFYTMNYLPDENMGMDIRIFRQKKLVLAESQRKCYELFARGKRKEMRADSFYGSVKLLCTGICGLAVYGLVAAQSLQGRVPVGDVLVLYSTVTSLILALGNMAETFTDLRNNNTHLTRYFAYMDLPDETAVNPQDSGAREPSHAEQARQTEQTGQSTEQAGQTEQTGQSMEQAGQTEQTGQSMEQTGQTERAGQSAERNGQNQVVRRAEESAPEIRFEHVSFRYPGSASKALRDVSLTIHSGEKLAIVGENGSGKTTLIKLLCRLYRPTEGRILVNGRDIWSYSPEAYQQLLSTVFQDFSLFAFSLGANVAASRSYDRQRVRTALIQAGLREKMERLPRGLDQALTTDYEEDGVRLSGGEAQKAAIARALYKDGAVLILDEPTAALDPYAEKAIYEHLFKSLERSCGKSRTLLSISHRLSTCRYCDRVAVFSQGRLAQLGTHRQLVLEKGSPYQRLWQAQARYYQEG